jgi:hypothetical protein
MKIVVCIAPDEAVLLAKLALEELNEKDFILDPEAYCHFRDEVFVADIMRYIENKHSGKMPLPKTSPGPLQSDWRRLCFEAGSGAAKWQRWLDTRAVIDTYYLKWKKRQPRFYLYKGEIYSWGFWGWLNVGNEIALYRYDSQEVTQILNTLSERRLRRVLKWLRSAFTVSSPRV